MDNLSQQKLMGNMQATSAELLSDIMNERGRGFASDREAWAQLKENIENAESRIKTIKDVHKDMWSAVKDHNRAVQLGERHAAGGSGGLPGTAAAQVRQVRRGGTNRRGHFCGNVLSAAG